MSIEIDGNATRTTADELRGSQILKAEVLSCPSLSEIFSASAQWPPALEPPQAESLPADEQEALLHSVEDALKNTEPTCEAANFESVPSTLSKLWNCQSQYLVHATEALANGSRNPSLRLVYGRAGILDFFLRLVASKEVTESSLILHALRLIGNSCADTDENRETVVKGNYTLAILPHLLRPELIQVVIPVIYNMCMDFEPAQFQSAANKIVYTLLKLVEGRAFGDDDALLEYVYELIELVGEQEQGIENSPDGTISLLIALTLDSVAELASTPFSCLVNCLVAYLNNDRFQNICIARQLVPDILSVLERSVSADAANSSEDVQTLARSRLKINQALAEISAFPLFSKLYPLDSSLAQTLKSWLTSTEDQLQICACIMLGNLARSDEVCSAMVRELKIHEELIAILNSDARGAVLHAALSFLKNLAIASENRLYLADAGIIPAVSRLWGYEIVPQVQLAATSITRQLIISSVDNISRLLDHANAPLEDKESDSSDNGTKRTYLSLLLALFEKSDSTPVKTEIGRIVASLCRTLVPKSKSSAQDCAQANPLLDSLFTGHDGVALPLGAMIIQTQWPVVRSEGWFALALMASTKAGANAVVSCLQKIDGFPLIKQALTSEEPSPGINETDEVQWRKDRDNIVVLVQELLRNDPETLDGSRKSSMRELMGSHVSKYLKRSN
ncbi:putative GTP binding protein [Aspergillus lucknowensis]|uniref:Armadillo-type protein n=1 Tax=Aspergillus lucknowensis TaxID=176173 RepID=A0ABR4LQK0_9EURO